MARIQAKTTALRPGEHLGDYQLLLEVGAGGMGRVWAARRLSGLTANPLVALKTGLGEVGGSPEFERLFIDEARIASQIDHPNACTVYELGRDRGMLYLVMEWCDGATLRDVLDGQPDCRLPYEVAARIIADVAAGLHAAHELRDENGELLNVVHRDVSPQNVLVWAAGHVKLADFGVAKARGQLHRPTETGEVKGKLSYMAPEQVTSPDIDRRSDVFGLGCLLYEATVGKRPYQGGDALATLYQLLERETVKPSEIVPDYPKGLEAIILNALERNPDDRYNTAAEMGRAIASWLAARRAVVNEKHVAAAVLTAVGDRVTLRRESIAKTAARLDSGEPLSASYPPEPGIETHEPTVRPVPERRTLTTLRNRSFRPRRERGIIAWLAVGASALVVVVVVLALGLGRREVAATDSSKPVLLPETDPRASADSDSATPDEMPEVVVTVRAKPAHAQLWLDDEKEASNPLVRRVAADGSRHVVVAKAPGYEPKTQRIAFDREHDIVIELAPLNRRSKRRGAEPPAATTRAPGTLPKPAGTKPVRPIDKSNPFGETN